jgi:hypothetical protein
MDKIKAKVGEIRNETGEQSLGRRASGHSWPRHASSTRRRTCAGRRHRHLQPGERRDARDADEKITVPGVGGR